MGTGLAIKLVKLPGFERPGEQRMNPNSLSRLDRKSLLVLAQKHKIAGHSALSKIQLIEKLALKSDAQSESKQNKPKTGQKIQISKNLEKQMGKNSSGKALTVKQTATKLVTFPKNDNQDLEKTAKIFPRSAITKSVIASKVQKNQQLTSNPKPIVVSSKKLGHKLSITGSQPSKISIIGSMSETSVTQPELVGPIQGKNKFPEPEKPSNEFFSTANNSVAKSVLIKHGKSSLNLDQQVSPPSPIIKLSEVKTQKSAARDTSLERNSVQSVGRSLPPGRASAQNPALPTEYGKDRVVVLVRDPHWIHCYWELSRHTVSRAQTALGQDFENAQPALRLVKLGDRDGSLGEQIVREFHLPDGARNWYVDVPEPGIEYCVDVGYRSKNGRFFGLGRSNAVSTPRVAWGDQSETVWAQQDNRDAERLFALSGGLQPHAGSAELRNFFEEKLGHNPGSPSITSLGSGGFGFLGKERNFTFNIDADLVVHGTTEPSAKVTFQGEPIPLRPDGSFSLRFRLADGRHIMPAVSISCTGMEERTIVLAVERNTKSLEPVVHEEEE